MKGEPRGMGLIDGFGAVGDGPARNAGVAAHVEDSRSATREVFRQVEIGGHVDARARLEVEFLHDDFGMLEPTDDGRAQIGALRPWSKTEHFLELGLERGAFDLPRGEGRHGARAVRFEP